MITQKERRENRAKLFEEIQTLAQRAGDKDHTWSDDDEQEWNAANKRYEALTIEIEQKKKELETGVASRSVNPDGPIGDGFEDKPIGSLLFRNERTGEEVRALEPNERLSRDEPEISVGRCLAAMLSNRVDELSDAEQRAMLGATDSGGGYLLSPALGTQVIDLARSASVALRAGARTIPMNTPELSLARITTDPTSVWRPELSAVTASSLTFDRITMRAKTLAAIVPVSIELIEDADNIATIIEQALQQALGLKLDQAVLLGKGSESEPLGIVSTGSVNAITGVGLPTDYAEITQAVGDIMGADYPGEVSMLSWILHPRDAETYDGLQDTTNQPMQPTPWAAALKRLHTTSLPSTDGGGSNESTSIVGNFPQVLIGIRKSVTIRVLDSGQVTDDASETFNAASQLAKFIVASLRADVAVLRPTWFTKLTGITA